MNEKEKAAILTSIASTEPTTWDEFLSFYDDTPAKGDKPAWAELFGKLKQLETAKLIDITYEDATMRYPRMESFQLTAEGAEWVREWQRR